ncbi:MAG: ATP-binding protein [Clostridia bacterium]|nr:ATP-binding protein [Clostridia bacterium]
MPRINVLPKEIAELIAAGEVVERPASALKEMIENAIDAGATRITAEIEHGGITYMRITDDGCGISRSDVKKAFLRHATSKIKKESDLDSIKTLGFRGEALASVAAVARVEMFTRANDEEYGTHYVIEGGAEKLDEESGCPKGTTVVVRDLFYNTPARMKSLKKD